MLPLVVQLQMRQVLVVQLLLSPMEREQTERNRAALESATLVPVLPVRWYAPPDICPVQTQLLALALLLETKS